MIVGEAHVVVRAITAGVGPEIRRAFKDRDMGQIGQDAGRNIADGMGKGIASGGGSGGSIFSSLAAQSDAARAQFDNLLKTAFTLGPALAGIIGSASSLIGAFAGMGAAAAGAIPSIAALGGVLAGLAVAGGTLKLAFSGVGEAIGAVTKAAGGGGGAASKAVKDLTAELRRLADARKRLSRLVKDTAEDEVEAQSKVTEAYQEYAKTVQDEAEKIAEARKNLDKVTTEGIEDVADAAERLADVEQSASRSILEAKNKVLKAQQDLNAAYEQAREEIQQLNFAAEGAAIGEKKAALELEKARETLLRMQDVPPNSRARKEAELAFAQADLNYRKAVDTNADMAKEQDRLAKEGVEGTNTVKNAKDRLAESTQDQADIEIKNAKDIAKAQKTFADAQITAIERVEAAKKKVADSETAFLEKTRSGWQEILDAEKDLSGVQQKNKRDLYDATLAVKRAEEDLAKARNRSNNAAAGGSNAVANALKNLSKEQKEFVYFMVDEFNPSIQQLKDAAAQEFFPKLIPAMREIKDKLFPALVPLLEETGSVLGDIAGEISGTLTSPQFIKSLSTIWDNINTQILPKVGGIASNVLSSITGLLEAAAPITEKFVGWIESITGDWAAMFEGEDAMNDMTTLLNTAGEIAGEIGDLFGNVFGGLGGIIQNQMQEGSAGRGLIQYFTDATAGFNDFANSASGQNRLAEYFNNVTDNAKPMLDVFGAVIKEFLKLGENENIGKFWQILKDADVAGTLGDIGNAMIDAGPAVADFIVSFVQFAKETLDSEAIIKFWETLTFIVDQLVTLFQNPAVKEIAIVIGQIAAVGVALRVAWAALKIPILAIINPIFKVASGFKAVGGALAKHGPDVKAFGQLVGEGAGIAGKLRNFALLIGPQGIIIGAIAGLVLAFIGMWNESEIFRKAIKDLIDGVLQKAITIFETLKAKVEKALEPLGGMEGVLDGLKIAFKFLGDIIGTYVIPLLEGGLKNALDIIGAIFGTIIDTIGNFIAAFMRIFNGIKTGDVSEIFGGIVDAIFAPFKALVSNLVDLFKNIWNNVVTAVKKVLGIASPSQVFLDIANDILDAIINVITFLPTKFLEFFTTMWTNAANFFTNTIGPALLAWPVQLATWIKGLWDKLFGFLEDVWKKVVAFWGPGGKVVTFLTKLPRNFVKWLKGLWDTFWDTLDSTWKKVLRFLGVSGELYKTLSGLPGKFVSWLSGLWSPLVDGLKAAWGLAKEWWNSNIAGKGFTLDIPDWLPGPDELTIKIPRLAEGGIVPATRGGSLAIVGEAGRPERVEPLDPDGLSKRDKAMIQLLSGGSGGGTTINVYPSEGMNEVQLANIVSREISFMMRKGSL